MCSLEEPAPCASVRRGSAFYRGSGQPVVRKTGDRGKNEEETMPIGDHGRAVAAATALEKAQYVPLLNRLAPGRHRSWRSVSALEDLRFIAVPKVLSLASAGRIRKFRGTHARTVAFLNHRRVPGAVAKSRACNSEIQGGLASRQDEGGLKLRLSGWLILPGTSKD